MASFETYLETAKDIRTKMKEILAMDASEFVKDPARFGEIRLVMREILPLSSDILESMRAPIKNHYIEELKKTNDMMKKMVEREEHLKHMISGMDTVMIIKVGKTVIEEDNQIVAVNPVKTNNPKHPIVKVKDYVTENIEGLGFKCNEISGLPDELEPWYGQKIEHGKILHKRIDLWLKKHKEKTVKKVKVAKASSVIIDASTALLSL